MGLKELFSGRQKQPKVQQNQANTNGFGFSGLPQNISTHGHPIYRGFDGRPEPNNQQQLGHATGLNQDPMNYQTNGQSPVSPLQPHGPDQIGFGQRVHELPGTGRRWATEPQQAISPEEYDRRRRDLELAKQKSERVAEKVKRAEAERLAIEQQRKASKESVRQLRELVRQRYRLDLSIWNEKDVLEADRELVLKDCHRADEILQHIYAIVSDWQEMLFDKEDWKVAQQIKDGLLGDELHVRWGQTPPWEFNAASVQDVVSDEEWNEWNHGISCMLSRVCSRNVLLAYV